MRKVIKYDDFKLNENSYREDERLNSSRELSASEREEIKTYTPKKNDAVDSLNGDIDSALELLRSIEDPLDVAKTYKDMLLTYPEWELTQEIIENKNGKLESKIIELASCIRTTISK